MNPIERAAQEGASQPQGEAPILTSMAASNAAVAATLFAVIKVLIDTKTLDVEKVVDTLEFLTSEARKQPQVDAAVVQVAEVIRSMKPRTGDSNG